MVAASVPTSSEGAVKKKSYHHGDLRNAIIHEATARARVSGEKAIVLREIAPTIGVSATAAYRHFANRQQLVEEVAARGYMAMGERLAVPGVAGAETDPALAAYLDLRNAAVAMVRFAVDEPSWARMMIETLGSSEVVGEQAGLVREHLQQIVERGIENGMFREGTRIDEQRSFWAAVDGLGAHAMFRVRHMSNPEADHAIARTIDLCLTDMLTPDGLSDRDAAELPGGTVTRLPL